MQEESLEGQEIQEYYVSPEMETKLLEEQLLEKLSVGTKGHIDHDKPTTDQPMFNRKQRRAMEAQARKLRKAQKG